MYEKDNNKDIFICYSRKDKDYLIEIAGHLKSICLSYWYDDNIGTGDRWNEKIESAINDAKIAILLISMNFFNSDYIVDKENAGS